mgnify:CR=1 FL=1
MDVSPWKTKVRNCLTIYVDTRLEKNGLQTLAIVQNSVPQTKCLQFREDNLRIQVLANIIHD